MAKSKKKVTRKKAVKKTTSKRKPKVNSVHLNFPKEKEGSLEDLKQQCSELKDDLELKDSIIKEYQKQLSLSNEVVLKMTKQINADLNILYKLHESLIPTHFPNIPNCEFSYKFISSYKGNGKDFYQIMPLYRMHFGLVMSSCVSHILSSLLFSARLRLMARTDYRKLQPAQVLEILIKEIKDQMQSVDVKTNVDIFYAITNQRKYQLTYCSLGKIFCLLYSISTGEIQELKPVASSFKGQDSIELFNQDIQLNPKDHLIVCSPGILECKNKEGEIFGKERLKKVIQEVKNPGAHNLRNKIIHSVYDFSNNKKFTRDASVVVMEIRDKILKLTEV